MAIKLRFALPILVAIISLGSIGIAQAAAPPVSAKAKIGPGVLEQIRDKGAANVMIALEHSQQINPSQNKLGRAPDMAAERSRIAQMRNSVSSQLAFHEYEERQSYRAVPALAGRIKSEAALLALAHNPHVIKIDLEQGFSGLLADSIPVIAADLRHALGNTGNGIVVAVIDSGLDTDHDNLSDDLITEVCFADDDGAIDGAGRCPNGSDRQVGAGAAEDDAGHGTHVTGIVTSNGTLGSVGAAPDAGIIAIKVTWGPTFAGVAKYFSEIVAAFDYIINNPDLGVQVINMSVGGGGYEGDCDADGASNIAMAAAINTLRANGVTTFASAGNDYSSTEMTTPACLSNVISVGASDNSDVAADFTNSNASTDIFAPGVDVLSSAMGNGTTTASGTSMSSPHAAGCAALLIEAGDATTPDEIEALLESSPFTVTVDGNGLTFPRIDCSTFVNIPPVCDANGPYTAECGLSTALDGTGSNDPNGDVLTYLWDGPFTDAPTDGSTPSVVFPTPTGDKIVSLTVNDGLESSQCSAQVTVQDTTAPSITAPADVSEECAAPEGTAVALGTATASDTCDPAPLVTNNAPDLFTLGDTTVTWNAIDDDGNQANAGQMVTIIDTTPPEIFCNAVDITPTDAPISFTASASDQCQGPLPAEITDYDCYVYTKKGKLVKKTKSCVVSFSGDQITILDSGGVSDIIEWTVTATDDSGNSTTQSCSLNVIKPGN